jgi:hypothetical protein
MSCQIVYKCDHCGAKVSPYINEQWRASFLTVGANIDDVHACSKEHLGLALAKTFGIDVNWKMVDEIERCKKRIAELEKDAAGKTPTSDHVHELGSCTHCDKPTTLADAIAMAKDLRDYAVNVYSKAGITDPAEPEPK